MGKYVNEDERLKRVLAWREPEEERTLSIGDRSREYFGKNLRRLKESAKIVDAWQGLLAEDMLGHCNIKKIEGGVIEVEVDSGAYLHEMRLMSNELVEHLRDICGRGKIKRIKLVAKGE